jgi:signal peptidase I
MNPGMVLFFVLLALLLGVKASVVGLTTIKGSSMAPRLEDGSTCLLLRVGEISVLGLNFGYWPTRAGDTVVAEHPNLKGRVIKVAAALGGNEAPNGPWQKRLKLSRKVSGKALGLPGLDCSKTGCVVELGHVFLLSESLEGSNDSRHFGAVPKSSVVGRVGFCF